MANYVPVQYREVPMRQLSSSARGWREINVSTGKCGVRMFGIGFRI